jgi:hypothetical protein
MFDGWEGCDRKHKTGKGKRVKKQEKVTTENTKQEMESV